MRKEDVVKHKLLFGLLCALLLLTPAALGQTTIRCETGECAFTGNAIVSLSHQLSNANCIEGKTWGVRGNRIWVNNGCRADFIITPRDYGTPMTGTSLRCESGGGRNLCAADTHYGVQLAHQLSKSGCIEGKSWGYNNKGVWVNHGCRADFVLAGPTYSASTINSEMVVCESVNNTKHRCATDTHLGVQIGRQLSDNNCFFGKSWGYDSRGIWVDRGCRAEFSVGR